MRIKLFTLSIALVLIFSLIATLTPQVRGASYTNEQWEQLIEKYQASLFGGADVDWTDPQIQAIVEGRNSGGFTTSGIAYNGGRYWLDLEKNRSNPGRLFGNQDITVESTSAVMGYQLVYLQHMARAYATYGATYTYKDSGGKVQTLQLYDNPELRAAIFYGLNKSLSFYNEDFWSEQRYGANNTATYNWWDWAYQAPCQIGRTLLALYPFETAAERETAKTLANSAIYFIDRIRPNTHSNPTSQMECRRTRINLMPMLAPIVKNGSLMDETKVNLTYFMGNDESFSDGVKEDGSYICHGVYAMEGRYGIDVLISRVIDTYSLLSGTAFEPETEEAMNQFYWMMDVFKPLMMDSGIMTQSNGREPQSALSMGPVVIKGALKLLGCFGPKEDLQLKQFIRDIIIGETDAVTQKAYARYAAAIGDVNLVNILKTVVFDQTIAEDDELYAVMRYKTDRVVQHRKDYTVGIAMSSNRISPYESISGRNRYGWFTGDGMVYVYNDATTYTYDQYGESFQRFANMKRVPGTTQEANSNREPWSNRIKYVPGTTYSYNTKTKQETWTQEYNSLGQAIATFVGGAELDGQFIAAAMDFESYSWTQAESKAEIAFIDASSTKDEYAENNKTKQVLVSDLKAKKSYFLFDDEIVCVGSDIDFSTRSGSVYTYVDNRELLEKGSINGSAVLGTEDLMVDGTLLEKTNSFSQPKTYQNPTWIYAENFGGYYFPQGGKVGINKTYRVSTADGNDSNDDYNAYYLGITPKTEQHSFYEIWLDHGSKPQNGTYSYVMLPEKTSAETAAYTQKPDVSILCATEKLHVIREHTLGITAMVFWEAGTYEGITVNAPCILMIREQTGKFTLSASDPSQSLSSLKITLNRKLYPTRLDPQMTEAGTDKTVLTLSFRGIEGKTLQGEFSVTKPNYLLFDFDTDSRARYNSSLYSYKDYSIASNWATANIDGKSVTIANGFLSVPLTYGSENTWNTNIEPSDAVEHFAWNTSKNYANFLRFNPKDAEIFQIRLKLKDAVQYGNYTQGVTLYYLPKGSSCWSSEANTAQRPNPAREVLKMEIPVECMDAGSLENQFITLTYDLRKSKFITYEEIQGIMIVFDSMQQGSVTVDYIYIGPRTDHLYFDFNEDAAALRYDQGAYGGFDFDREDSGAWASACSDSVDRYYTIDNEKGTLSLYVGSDYYATLGVDEHYGPYLETSSVSGTYPWSQQDKHPLSYDPRNAEIVELRFRTEALERAPREHPHAILLYVAEKNGVSTRYAYNSVEFSIDQEGYQMIQIPLPKDFREADYIKSLGFRFRGVKSKADGSVGKIEIDYIYVGSKAHAPSQGVLFDFTNSEEAQGRYQGEAYGGINFDTLAWSHSSLTSTPVMDHQKGTMSVTVKPDETGYIYVQTGRSLQNALPLSYKPHEAEYIQLRFKLENFVSYTDTRMSLYYYTNENSHINGKDTLQRAAIRILTPEEIASGEYITMTLPVPESMKEAERITAFRMDLYGCSGKSDTELGTVTFDYLFVGKKNALPHPFHMVRWFNADGTLLGQTEVVDGQKAIYTGIAPQKAYDDQQHYSFKGWDKDQSQIVKDTEFTAQYRGEPHSLTYVKADDKGHRGTCACGYTIIADHRWDQGTVTTAPSCTAQGVRTYTCTTCRGTKTETIAPTGHSYTLTPLNEQQHTRTCSNCSQKDTPAHSFTYRPFGDHNKHERSCSCGYTDKTEGHRYSFSQYSAQQHTRTCSTCGFVDQANHPFTYTTTGASQHKRYCKWCSYEDTVSHTWNSGSITTAASCTTAGVKTFTCTPCSQTRTESIAATGHNYTNYTASRSPVSVIICLPLVWMRR